jgi:osmotically-inducible protein OsmY
MEKRSIVLRYFVSLMLIATFVACASTPTRESTGEYIDDSVITTKIKSLLLKDELLKSFHIGVKTYRGIVQLSGSVDSQKTAAKAGQIASSVKGVKSVKNKLVVK